MTTYAPGIYVKGDVEREAFSASQAVAFVFEGFKLKVEEAPAEAPVAVDPEPASTPTPKALAERPKKDDK